MITFHCYFKRHGYHIHRNTDLITDKHNFVALLRALTVIKKKKILSLYTDATRRGMVKRNYKIEYALWGSRKVEKQKQQLRVKNRREYERKKIVIKGDKTQIHHIDGNVFNNSSKNLKVMTLCAHNQKHGKKCKKTK
jgi:hypothetical protein